MYTKLDPHDYVHLAETLAPGDTERFDHDACGDTRKRLYVTRSEDGKYVLGYCHNCGLGSRALLRSRHRLPSVPKSMATSSCSKTVYLPPESVACETAIGYGARRWLESYDIDVEGTAPYLYWDRGSESLIMAAWSSVGLEGYQARCFRKGYVGPKYLTYRSTDACLPQPVRRVDTSEIMVVCEDTVSAIKVMQAGHTGVPLWSAPGSVDIADRILGLSTGYNRVIIWFDNDNPQVRASSLKLARRLRAYRGGVEIVMTHPDPKHCNIAEVIEEY